MKTYSIILVILAIIVSFLGLPPLINPANTASPIAHQGILDLRHYDFDKNDPVRLDGEWEFVSGQLVSSSYFDEHSNTLAYVSVPSLWKKYIIQKQSVPLYHRATYRLKVKLNHNNQILGIKTSNIRMSNSIYINGNLIGQSGIPKDNDSYVAQNTPYVAYFHTSTDVAEIIIQVANFDYASGGGIIGSIYLGNEKSISSLREKSVAYDWIMISSLLIMGVYFLGFYLHLRKDIHLLFFSLFCFAMVLYSATHGEKLLYNLSPQLSYELFERFQMVSSNLLGFFLLLYYHFSLRQFSSQKFVRFISGIGGLLLVSLVLPISIHSRLQPLYSIYLLLIFLYLIYIQIKAISRKVTGAMYLVSGSLVLVMYFIVGTLNVLGNIDLTSLPPALPFVYLLMLSLFMAHRFADTFQKNEELSSLLLQSDKFKDEFLAKTSHEFRTPLHGIIAIVQSMLSHSNRDTLTTDQSNKLSLVVDIAQRLSYLVNDILDLSKLKQGELQVAVKNVDLYSTAYVLSEIFSYMISKDITIRLFVPRDLPNVKADEERLRQILYNLMNNAVTYTHKGTIDILAREEDGFLVVSIKDTGEGIAADHLMMIFEPFQQYSASQRNAGGVGLGLNITKQLVELQGGQIWVESEIGMGSTFHFTLPVAPQTGRIEKTYSEPIPVFSPSHPARTFPYVTGEPAGKKIMIADDDHTNLQVLVNALQTEGYYIIAVDHGQSVLEQLEKHADIDLILLDIMMPEISGYEVCRKIRETYSLSELPVLMLTAAILPEDMVAAFQSGANDFLHKPLDLTELKTRMRNLMMMKESARTAIKMEVAFLQAQIKPHFLYNVLNSILSLSYINIEESRKLITNFATFLRESFVFSNTDQLVPLHKELSLLQSYVEIEKARFPEKLQFQLVREKHLDGMIPPLLLQPIVENAIRHGIMKKAGHGNVSLTITQNRKHLIFQILDNGVGMTDEQIEQLIHHHQPDHNLTGVGLRNIMKRIKQYSGASLTITSEEQVGTMITITFPHIKL